jgi:16S rRNA G1207 methylase RsmC
MSDRQYFSSDPQVPSAAHSGRAHFIRLRIGSRDLVIASDSGVFARKGIDQGTQILIDSAARPPRTGTFLDLGCGYGPIALTMAAHSPEATIYAVDVNPRAQQLTIENAQRNSMTNIITTGPDGIAAHVTFDLIWSNPPIRIGKAELHRLLTTWLSRLSTTGEAWLVINRNLGSDSLAVWLSEQGYSVDRLTSKRGFRVLRVRPTHGPDLLESSA